MKFSCHDQQILRHLAAELASAASDTARHNRTRELWRAVNQLQMKRPPVILYQIPWQELQTKEDVLQLQCCDPFARELEENMRQTLYAWKNFPADMVIDPYYSLLPIYHDSGFGLKDKEENLVQNAGDLSSHQYTGQIQTEEDALKITPPVITLDSEATMARLECATEAFGDLLPVRSARVPTLWFAPWDELIRWWGVDQLFMDLILKPDLVHLAISRLVDAHISRWEQLRALNLVGGETGNYAVGSGGLAFSEEMPQDFTAFDDKELWGSCAAQIFTDISPEMFEEFALQHERRWFERFKFSYYGCCEALHNKIPQLRTIPNLRKVSCSPWCKLEPMAEAFGDSCVLSIKPNPAHFARPVWNPKEVREYLTGLLERTENCNVEFVAKDISTVAGDPRRLREWEQIAMEVVEKFAR